MVIPIRGVVTTTSGGGVPSSSDTDVARTTHVGPRVAAVEPERLAELGGPVGELPAAVATLRHDVDALEGQHGPQQHRLAVPVGTGHDVRAVVHAVREVDVQVPGRPEHHRGPGRRPTEGVGGRLVGPVRLDLDDAARTRSGDEHLVEELRGDRQRVAGEERARQPATARHRAPRVIRRASRAGDAATRRSVRTGLRPARGRHRPATSAAAHRRPARARRRHRGRGGRRRPRRRAATVPVARWVRTSSPTTAWASRNGVPRTTSHSARSVADVVSLSAAACIRSGTNVAVSIIPPIATTAERDLVDRVEQRLLVLLEVAVVGERQALQRRQQAGEVADEAARLAAGELGDVGVLLLRHHRRPRGVGVVEPGEAELLARPQHPLLAEAGEVDADQGEVEQRLGDEVAIADRVERVGEHVGEAERRRRRRRVDRQRRARQRAGAERRHVEALDGGDEAVDVAGERPAVGEQVVGEQHRLGPLHVGVAGQVRVAGGLGPGEQDVLQADDEAGDGEQLALAPQPQVGRDLVVAAAGGVDLGAGRAGELGDPALDGGVDVLVALDELERVGRQLVLDAVERAEDLRRPRCPSATRRAAGRRRGRASRRCRRATGDGRTAG